MVVHCFNLFVSKFFQAKIPSARSLDDIAMDLTDTGMPKVSKLTVLEAKNQLIMASSGSLISSGRESCPFEMSASLSLACTIECAGGYTLNRRWGTMALL